MAYKLKISKLINVLNLVLNLLNMNSKEIKKLSKTTTWFSNLELLKVPHYT